VSLNYFIFSGLRGPESLSVIDLEVVSEADSGSGGRSQDFFRGTHKFSKSI